MQLSDGDGYDGGDREFHLSGLDAAKMRQQGARIAFRSFHEHRVTPVIRGERFSLVAWIDGPHRIAEIAISSSPFGSHTPFQFD